MQKNIDLFKFKGKRISGLYQDHYDLLQKQLAPIARSISSRAVLFLHKLFSNLMKGNQIQESLLDWTYSIKNPTAGHICSKVMNQKLKSIGYRCYDCMQSENSCICQECFVKGDHQGHNYYQYKSTNAVCDCGNQQLWNQKSSCPAHKKGSQLKEEIQPKTRKQFIQEYTLAFYIFFAFNQTDALNTIKQFYGAKLISSLLRNVNKNYQMKILGYELLQVSFPAYYPPLSQNNQFTILQKIFRGPQIANMKQFCQVLYQIFPVEQSRIKIIKEYFRKTKDMELTIQHPISNIKLQYMTCAKIISKLIKNKELQPLSLNRGKCPKKVEDLASIFCQYYWNLEFIKRMKSARQYHVLHLQKVNVAQMAFYRQYGRIKCSQNSGHINLDEFYLKQLGYMVTNAIDEKLILLKCIKELFQYIENEEMNRSSQAQERALAMFTFAFFDGDISQLFKKQIRTKFVQNLQISKQKFAKLLRDLIKTSLKSYSLYGIPPISKTQKYTEYLLENNRQNNFNYFLDLIYHKILMMISIDYFQYDKIIQEIFMELVELNQKRTNQKLLSIRPGQLSLKNHIVNIYQTNMKSYQTIKRAVKFLNTLTMIELDEIVLSNFLKINPKQQKQRIYAFYTRLLSSFKQLSTKQFKALAISIINNEQVFEQFVKDRTVIQKGKLINKVQAKPLQTYSYNYLFESYNKSILETEVCLYDQVEDRGKYSTINIFNSNTTALLKQICLNILEQLSVTSKYADVSNNLFSQFSLEVFKIYFYNRKQTLHKYFQSLMNQEIRKNISVDLTKQIIIVEKEKQQYQVEREKIKNEKETSDKKKRQKMLNIRREKIDMIRKKQQNFLMNLQDKIEQQSQPQPSNCIYCKQTKQQQLNFISYVNFTGLVEKGILKNNVYPQNHLFFTTCGHKIHQSCYRSVSDNSPSKFCFLCKRETNVLVPELSQANNISLLEKQTKIQEFLSNIVPILISDLNEYNTQMYSNLIGQISSDQDIFIYFVYGFVRELVYTGLQNFKYFHKSQFYLYYQIFQMIRCRPKTILEKAFFKINKLYHKNLIYLENKLNSLQRYIMVLLETSLVIKIDDTDHKFIANLSQLQIQQVHKIVNLFTAEKPSLELTSITNFSMISPIDLFIALPENLNELLKNMGQCPLCPNITNQIYMCMLCGWSACKKCQKMLFKHSSTDHIDGSVFIACFNGQILFIQSNKTYKQHSIYQNYLGTSYIQPTSIEETSKLYKLQKFKLSHEKLEEIYKTVLMYGIHQKVFKK